MTDAALPPVDPAVAERPPLALPIDADAVEVRAFRPEDALGLARLTYAAEGGWTFQRALCDPEELRRLNAAGEMRSYVAVWDEQVVGHVACELSPESAAVCSGRLYVDDRARHHDLAERLMRLSFEDRSPDTSAYWSATLSAHPFSQRAYLHLGFVEAAVELGYVPWPAFSPSPPAPPGVTRDGVFRHTLPCRPSQRPAELPARYREFLEATYARLGVETTAPPGPPAREAAVSTLRDEPVDTVEITLAATGPGWEQAWGTALGEALDPARGNPVVIYADLRLPGNDVEAAVQRLNGDGFAYAGLLLGDGPAGEDALRLQRPLPSGGVLDAHTTASPWAAELRTYVLADLAHVGDEAVSP